MENIRDLQIQVDLLYGALPVSRNLKQGDTTRLTLTVFRGGKSYPLESLTPILNAKRADKLIYIQTSDYDVNDNSIAYNLAPQIVAEPGRLQLEIELDDADGNIISSFTIGITVEPRLFNGEEDVAPDDQNEIIDAARDAALSVAQARDAAQTAVDARDTAVQTINTSRDNAVANVNEAADKRVDEINAMGVNGTVRFDEAQDLSAKQQATARSNIGAGGVIVETAQGDSVVTVNDSAEAALRGLRIFGKSTQDGTPSPDAPVPIVSVGDDGDVRTAVSINTPVLPITASGIPVTSGGNYTDADGQQWVCDEVDFGRGVYVQRIGRIDSYSGEAIDTEYLSTTGGLTTGARVLYILATPVETPLTEEQLTAYRALRTQYPTTNVNNDEGAGMEITYVADTKSYIDQRFAELSAAILNV